MSFLPVILGFLAGLNTCFATRYFVVVQTANAGTRDRVSIKIQGPRGVTSPHYLDSIFDGQSVRTFRLDDRVDVGEPSHIYLRVQSRDDDFEDRWIPRQVVVKNLRYHKWKVFYYNKMLLHNQWVRLSLKCPPGLQTTSGGECRDIDECQLDSKACKDKVAVCQNTHGSFRCNCPRGYKKRGDGCEDSNECRYQNGHCEHYCRNTEGSYYCECRWGYKKVGRFRCEDIDECTEDSNACDKNSTICVNTIGRHQCRCKRGFLPTSDRKKCKRAVCYHPVVQPLGALVSPASCLIGQTSKHGDVCTTTCKPGWELKDPAVNKQTCDDGIWIPYIIYCSRVKCPPIQPPLNGFVRPDFCKTKGYTYGNSCHFGCHSSYRLRGQPETHCLANQTWDFSQSPACEKVYVDPWIRCPPSVQLTLLSGASVANVSYKLVKPRSNRQYIKVSPRKYENKTVLVVPVGTTKLTFVASNEIGKTESCDVYVVIQDKEKPTLVKPCPNDIYIRTPKKSAKVSWVPPRFRDNVGVTRVTSDKQPGSEFREGYPYIVSYTATDGSGNKATCSFAVNVTRKDCHKNPQDPENGVFSCFEFNDVKYCTPKCKPSHTPFRNQMYVSCDRNTETWIPKTADCVEFSSLPPSGKCPSGMEYQDNSMSVPSKICQKCPKGMKYNSTLSKCEDCPKGFISTQMASTQCTKCPDGYTTLGPGSKACVLI